MREIAVLSAQELRALLASQEAFQTLGPGALRDESKGIELYRIVVREDSERYYVSYVSVSERRGLSIEFVVKKGDYSIVEKRLIL